MPPPKAFADAGTADHKILSEEDESRDHDHVSFIVQDRYTNWLQAYAAKTNEAHEVVSAFQKFFGPDIKPKHVYTDKAPELKKATDKLEYSYDTATPHRSETNGVAERAVRRVREGTACALIQSGLSYKWWHYAQETYCFLRNVVDLQADNQTSYRKRFGEDFRGPIALKSNGSPSLTKIKVGFIQWVQVNYLALCWAMSSMRGEDGPIICSSWIGKKSKMQRLLAISTPRLCTIKK